ncbi:MAG TPA: hypothetical protein VGO59_01740 [Verrucomicrobiae bacterium]
MGGNPEQMQQPHFVIVQRFAGQKLFQTDLFPLYVREQRGVEQFYRGDEF